MSSGFAPLLIWVISLLPINIERIALALEATTRGNKFLVLSINVLLAGCGIPIAWSIVKANQPGSGQPHWQKLLRQLKEAVPTGWTVIVPADRGLYAPWLYQVIVEAGWHPFLGINQQGLVKISSHGQWQPLAALVSAPGQSWSGQVVCFKTNPLACTLLARWDSGYQEPWLVLTDLSPQRADALWSGLRPSRSVFTAISNPTAGNGKTQSLLDPQRAERLWLAMAVATLWMVMLGGEAENQSPEPNLEQLPHQHTVFSKTLHLKPLRQLSCFLLGSITRRC